MSVDEKIDMGESIPKGWYINKEIATKLREMIYMIEHESVLLEVDLSDKEKFEQFMKLIKYFSWRF